ncbi:molybdenum cofactor biosynthesis protein [bacterium CPR1]|nr:molybdenum cofactor biosynthesis protein [bacterium CPR1]
MISCLVITVSDTLSYENDPAGQAIRSRLEAAGHGLLGYHLVPDDPMRLKALLIGALGDHGIRAILLSGGTSTVDVVEGFLERRMEGFGELFRFLLFQEVGSSAVLARTLAGFHRGRVLIALPEAPQAVELAMDRLIAPELANMVAQAWR